MAGGPRDEGVDDLDLVRLGLAAALHGVIMKDDERDLTVWVEYLENVMKRRGAEWRDLYTACKELS